MNIVDYDNVILGSGILSHQIYNSLTEGRAINPIYNHRIEPLETGVMITGGTCYDYDNYTEIDEKCGARTLRLDWLANAILNTIKERVLNKLEKVA